MNPELVMKYGSGLIALGGVLWTIVTVSEKGNGAKFELGYGSAGLELGRQINDGNTKVILELRDFKKDVDQRMDKLAIALLESEKKTSKELEYLRGLSTQTHIDLELMKKKWNFPVTDSDRKKFMDDLVAAGKAARRDES